MTTHQKENQLKKLLLNYASHLTQSCEYVKPITRNTMHTPQILSRSPKQGLKRSLLSVVNSRPESHGYGQGQIVNGVGHLILIINHLLSQKGKLLVVNCTEKSARKLVENKRPSWASENRFLFYMEGGWINGSCSNWSHLCKVAWNSPRVSLCDPALRSKSKLEKWVTEAESVYRGLYLQSKQFGPGKHKLAYKRKADCIFLINPTSSAIKECQALNIPLCLLSTTNSFKSAHCDLDSNHESYFLIYFINCVINYYKNKL